MPNGHIMMAMSLDGFVARTDHSLDWLNKQQTAGEDHGFEAFQDSVDSIVMGTGSFRTLLGFDGWAYSKPVIVQSRTLSDDDIPAHLKDKVEITREDPETLMKTLDARGQENVYIDGGAIIRTYLGLGYIKSIKLTIVPILLGDGIRIFGDIDRDIDLKLQGVTNFPSGLVTLEYRTE